MSTYTAEDYEVLEPGVYRAKFDRAVESDEPGQFGFWIDWYFATETDDGVVSLMGRSSKPEKFTRATKARQWVEAILGRELAKGEAVDLEALPNVPVSLTVDVVKTEKGDERNRIVSIRRIKTVNPTGDGTQRAQAAVEAKRATAEIGNQENDPENLAPLPDDFEPEKDAA